MNTVYNVATNEYKQQVDCAEIQGTASTGNVPIKILNSKVEFIKIPDNLFVEKDEIFTYTLTFKNTSDLTIDKIELIDVIPEGLTLVPNTLKVNGSSVTGDIQTGVVLNNKLLPGGQLVATFDVKVTAIPPTVYKNSATAKYYYQVATTSGQRTSTVNSNTVTAQAVQGLLAVKKTANKIETQLGERIIYTITITNEGNVDAVDMVLTDELPPQVAYIPNTVTLNGVLIPGANLTAGVKLGTLKPGATDVVQFEVEVIDDTVPVIPNRGSIDYYYAKDPNKPPVNNTTPSNFVVVPVQRPKLSLIKSTTSTTVSQGDIVTYTIAVQNTGTLVKNNVTITDKLPAGMSFVPNSIMVNGVTTPGDLTTGINIGTLNVGATSTISFKAKVDSVPPNTFVNSATGAYTYVINGTTTPGTAVSNEVIVTSPTPPTPGKCTDSLSVMKLLNKAQAQLGEEITYQIMITNIGKAPVMGVTLTDNIDHNLALVPGSVMLNGVAVTGQLTNLSVGTIAPGVTAIVSFKARVTGGCVGSYIPNYATVSCGNSDSTVSGIQTNTVKVMVIPGDTPPCPCPCPPAPPCPPQPPCPCPCPTQPTCPAQPTCQVKPNCSARPSSGAPHRPDHQCPPEPLPECRIERVITPIYLPNYMTCIEEITGISGFIKSVKPVNCGRQNKLLVVYIVKIEYTTANGLIYSYQECEEVYMDSQSCGNNASVDIASIEHPYVVDSHYVEVIVNMRVC